jgi:hypothetical protein
VVWNIQTQKMRLYSDNIGMLQPSNMKQLEPSNIELGSTFNLIEPLEKTNVLQ